MFIRDPFDFAPGSSRHTRVSWLTLAVGLAFACFCAMMLAQNFQALKQAEGDARKQQALLNAKAVSDAASKRDPAGAQRMKAQRHLQDMLRMSWSGLFDALESSAQKVDGGVAVLALTPTRIQSDAAEVGLTALALSDQVMLDYLRALQASPQLREVKLSAQQPVVNGGVPVVRFQLAITWKQTGDAR
jgi:Tfp pilus assembly protein PilN